jgi:prepilin-type N-terminal cleavage/methylation domain-containing protein
MSKQIKRQAGFTLVELAVVMIIIGLLIGGVLKGQELIGNAQVTSTVSQVKGIDAATSTFRDMYNALPGDMANADTRLANCAACGTGDGNQILNSLPSAAPGGEALDYFVHLSAADLVTGIDPGSTAGAAAWGVLFPSAPIRGSGFTVGSAVTAANLSAQNGGARAGIYLSLTNVPNAAPAAALNPNQAQRIDVKLDDGVPAAGSVRANAGACSDATTYTEDTPDQACFLQIRIQG